MQNPFQAFDPTAPVWTPDLAGDDLVAASRWAWATAGRVGPAGFRSGLPSFYLLPDERAEEGWDRYLEGDEDDKAERKRRRSYSAAQISWMEQVLWWPSTYLADLPGPASVLKIWLRCKVVKRPFDEACKAKKWSRATAYRARDRALGAIASGLIADRVFRFDERN